MKVYLILVVLFTLYCVGSCGRFDWVNCHKVKNKIMCDVVNVIPDDEKILTRIYKDYVVLTYFWDTKQVDICSSNSPVFDIPSFKSCEEYFCEEERPVPYNGTEKEKSVYSLLANYCQYCKRDNFEQFHTNVDAGLCPSFSFPKPGHCSRSATDGWPTVSARLLGKIEKPVLCQCPIGTTALFSYKCDAFSYFVKPVFTTLFPIFIVVVYILFSIFTVFFYILPFIICLIKKLLVGDFKSQLDRFGIDTYILICVFMLLHHLLTIVEFVFWLPVSKLFYTKKDIGTGFFLSYSVLFLFFALFTLFAIWLNVMRKTKHGDTSNGMATRFKLLLLIVYSILSSMGIIPFICQIPILKEKRILDRIFVPSALLGITIIAICFAVYGMYMYFIIKRDSKTKDGFWQLKFTKFIITATVLLLVIDFQLIFMVADFANVDDPPFGVPYREVSYQIVYLTMLLLDLVFMIQLFRSVMVAQAYPCLSCFVGKNGIKWSSIINTRNKTSEEPEKRSWY
jgi:hypothetical protein